MTIDEAIKHAREIAKESREEAMNAFFPPYADECESCAEEHEQLVSWLEELKTFKEKFAEILLYDHEIAERKIYEKAYNKAIDDLTEKIVGYGTYDYYGNVIDVLEIAEKLKRHKTLNIIHCKDCKHWGTGVPGETENVKCCEYGKYMVGANGYCVYGEKECAE